jgi:ubiquinol-cytochrome c reductase cytochrome b subunit
VSDVSVPPHHDLDDRARELVERELPPRKLFPGIEAVYVHRWTYLFGVGAIVALMSLFLTGFVLAFKGPSWFHVSEVGLFVNSMHFWSVQLFFFCMVAHMIVQFLTGTYRGKRWSTWIIGSVAYFTAIITAFTGYLSQTNFESQWVATQGKDAFNALGIGWVINMMNSGQMLTMHIVLLPIGVAVVVAVHVLLVRSMGICPPYDVRDDHLGAPGTEGVL